MKNFTAFTIAFILSTQTIVLKSLSVLFTTILALLDVDFGRSTTPCAAQLPECTEESFNVPSFAVKTVKKFNTCIIWDAEELTLALAKLDSTVKKFNACIILNVSELKTELAKLDAPQTVKNSITSIKRVALKSIKKCFFASLASLLSLVDTDFGRLTSPCKQLLIHDKNVTVSKFEIRCQKLKTLASIPPATQKRWINTTMLIKNLNNSLHLAVKNQWIGKNFRIN